MTLLGKLLMVQAAHGWTDREMAAMCGLKEQMWLLLKGGKAQFSTRVLGHICLNFAGLHDDVVVYLESLATPDESLLRQAGEPAAEVAA